MCLELFSTSVIKIENWHIPSLQFFSYLMEMNYMKPSTTDVNSRLYIDGHLYLTDTSV